MLLSERHQGGSAAHPPARSSAHARVASPGDGAGDSALVLWPLPPYYAVLSLSSGFNLRDIPSEGLRLVGG
eukprot:6089568-Pyramimonas_sp.AAC.2